MIGCYSITSNRDEVRLYPREARLDNAHCSTELVEAQVLWPPPSPGFLKTTPEIGFAARCCC